jgi:DNA-binding response OmpR family regulator
LIELGQPLDKDGLRRKLEPVPTAPRHIHTERGVGYVFATPVERF